MIIGIKDDREFMNHILITENSLQHKRRSVVMTYNVIHKRTRVFYRYYD